MKPFTHAFSGFSIKDLDTTKEFYSSVLGFNITQTKEGLGFTLPGGGEVFMYPKADHQPASFTVLNFNVENIDEAVDEMIEKGIIFERYDGMIPGEEQDEKNILRGSRSGNGPDIAWLKDPSGNILSIIQSN